MKRLFCAFLAGLLLSSTALAVSEADGTNPQEQIAYVQERGLFYGTADGFAPDQPLTRAQAIAVLARQARVGGQDAPAFQDVPGDAYYRAALGWACANDLIQGVSGAEFAPQRPVTHAQLAELLTRYLSWLGRDGETVEPQSRGTVTRGQSAAYFAALDRRLLARDTDLLTHTAADGTALAGKLDLPAGDGPVDSLVFFVNGSGPNTYDNRRQMGTLTFNYFDLFAEQFGMRNAAFFRTNTRGTSAGDQPPMFTDVDETAYRTYLPGTSVSDIGEWIRELRKTDRLKNTKIYLLGWSEGTIIAPLAAKQFPGEIAGLLLAGYANDRMDEIFHWQSSGASSMIFYRQYFDADGDGKISPEEFEADPYGVRAEALGGATFAQLDLNGDGALTEADFAIILAPGEQAFYDAVDRGDDAWLAQNYGVRLTSGWFNAHRQLAPNRETMLTLDLPIAIFHGTLDANCSVEGVRAIEQSFEDHGKDNLATHIYEGYDHDLLYSLYALYGTMPQAFEDLFQSMAEIA